MDGKLKIAVAFLYLGVLIKGGGLFAKKKFFLDKMENCPIQKTYTSTIRNVKIHYPEKSLSLDYEIVNTKSSPTFLVFTWEIVRCANKENPDTCVKINSIRTKNFCRMISAEGESWSAMLNCMTPKITCPIKKGLNVGNNCTVDLSALRLFPMGDSYWKFRCAVYDGNDSKMRLCVDMACYMKEQ